MRGKFCTAVTSELVHIWHEHGRKELYQGWKMPYSITVERHIILTNGFIKKTQKTPPKEIERAKKYRADYLRRKESSK